MAIHGQVKAFENFDYKTQQKGESIYYGPQCRPRRAGSKSGFVCEGQFTIAEGESERV